MLMNMLKRADLEKVVDLTRRRLDGIVRGCEGCQLFSQKPRRFNLSLRKDKTFNHMIFVDIFYVSGNFSST